MSPMSPQGSPPVPVVRKGREQLHLSQAITKAVKDKARWQENGRKGDRSGL